MKDSFEAFIDIKSMSGHMNDPNNPDKVIVIITGWPKEGEKQKAYVFVDWIKDMENYDCYHVLKVLERSENGMKCIVEKCG